MKPQLTVVASVALIGLTACFGPDDEPAADAGAAGSGGDSGEGGEGGNGGGAGTGGVAAGGVGGGSAAGGIGGAGGASGTTGAGGSSGVSALDAGPATTCDLPFDPGPCEAAIEVWWFDADRGSCQKQIYGGCEGNANRFDTQAACQDACVSPGDTSCSVDDDCGWGEIGHEIVTSADCICLFGCPSIPLNNHTIDRRLAQHQGLCDPGFNGQGEQCPIDDCAQPAPAMCIDGKCTGDPFGGL